MFNEDLPEVAYLSMREAQVIQSNLLLGGSKA